MWPFARQSPLERRLLDFYSGMLKASGFPSNMAKQFAKELISMAKEQARSDPDLPPNTGNLLIEREATDDSIRQMLAKKKADGVTDDDIRWWWSLDKLERRLIIAFDDWFRMAAYTKHSSEGLSREDSAAKVRSAFPIFGDQQETDKLKGDDRPLPFELKDRVNKWIERQMPEGIIELAEKGRDATSMNAIIRNEIRAGRL